MSFWTIIMILAIIIFVVLPSLKPRTMPVKKLVILPAVFLWLFYDSLTTNFQITSVNIAIVIVGFIVGTLLGYLIKRNTNLVIADQAQQLITLPGSYSSLVLFVIIFAVHFILGYYQSVTPVIFQQNTSIVQILLFALTIASSLSLGTNSCLLAKYVRARNS